MTSHVVITGTGRAGTTFLMQLLTRLGEDTGYSPDSMRVDLISHAGLERDFGRNQQLPRFVKTPRFCDYAERVLQRDGVRIDHVIIPMRDLHSAAESRRRVVRESGRPDHAGGFVFGQNDPNQEPILLQRIYRLMLSLSAHNVRVTLLQFPKLAMDPRYLWSKLVPVLSQSDYSAFRQAFMETVQPDLIHSFHE